MIFHIPSTIYSFDGWIKFCNIGALGHSSFLLQTNSLVQRTKETLYAFVRICNLIRRNIIRLLKERNIGKHFDSNKN